MEEKEDVEEDVEEEGEEEEEEGEDNDDVEGEETMTLADTGSSASK